MEQYRKIILASGSPRRRELLARILPETELYRYVQASTDGMYWASRTEIDYDELSFGHFHALSEDCVFCTVSFSADMTANTWYSELSYDMRSGYQLLLVRTDGVWLAAAQANLGE